MTLRPAILVGAMWCGAWGAQCLHPGLALHLPGAPWNWILTLLPVAIAGLGGALRPEHGAVRAVGGGAVAIAGLLTVALSCWPIAVFPVGVEAPGWLHHIGLGDPLSSLPFLVALGTVVVNLAASLGRRLRVGPDRLRFGVLHAGLLIAIVGGAAGNGGLTRARFVLEEGAVASDLAQTEDGRAVRLPVALRLDDFILERFPPMLIVADTDGTLHRGEALLGPGISDNLRGLRVAVEDWMASAAVPDGLTPVPFGDPGSNPAAKVVVRDEAGQPLGGGWLYPGGPNGAALFLGLPGGRSLHMEAPRPRRYRALVQVAGERIEVAVNTPLRVSGWAIYLLSYDEALGPASPIAVFEAVEDRTLPAVYLGIALLLLGVLAHLWRPHIAGARP